MRRAAFGRGSALLAAVIAVAAGCGSSRKHDAPNVSAAPPGNSAPGISGAGSANRPPRSGAGGASSDGGEAGTATAGEGGARSDGGTAPVSEADAGANDAGAPSNQDPEPASDAGAGGAVDEEPAPAPVCARSARFGSGELIPLSTSGDDLFESVTPDGLALVFALDRRFYLAERADAAAAFGAPVEVAAGLEFDSVSLSADGLRLVGAGPQGFAELTRAARTTAFSSAADDTAFVAFNAAVNGTPTDETAVEPLLGMNDTLLVYSFVSPSTEGPRPTLFASAWLGAWSFGTALPGRERLWADGQLRRVATGLSSDGLTLFYRDEVAGEFRRAWRLRETSDFDAFESLGDLSRAAPADACRHLYYSAAGPDGGLDLFVAEAE